MELWNQYHDFCVEVLVVARNIIAEALPVSIVSTVIVFEGALIVGLISVAYEAIKKKIHQLKEKRRD